jgi:uncharacterized protein (DUF2267 family)
MSLDAMTDYVMNHGGVEEREAKALLERTLNIFACALTAAEAQRLAADLPAPTSNWLASGEHGETFGPDELYARVRRRSGLEMGVAVEQAQVAIAAMVRELRPETRSWIEHRLGGSWVALLQVPRRDHTHVEAEQPRTLAEGRAGSGAPLSESAPSRMQPDSVADDNPYGDRKVSSGHDVHSEPIGSSNPRSRHPLSEHENDG